MRHARQQPVDLRVDYLQVTEVDALPLLAVGGQVLTQPDLVKAIQSLGPDGSFSYGCDLRSRGAPVVDVLVRALANDLCESCIVEKAFELRDFEVHTFVNELARSDADRLAQKALNQQLWAAELRQILDNLKRLHVIFFAAHQCDVKNSWVVNVREIDLSLHYGQAGCDRQSLITDPHPDKVVFHYHIPDRIYFLDLNPLVNCCLQGPRLEVDIFFQLATVDIRVRHAVHWGALINLCVDGQFDRLDDIIKVVRLCCVERVV